MDDITTLLSQAGKLIEDHAWLPLASLVIFFAVRLVKDDRFVAWCPIVIPPRYRSLLAVALGAISGVLQALTTGAKWPTAIVGGLISAYTAIAGHDLVVESIRKGRDIGVPKDEYTGQGPPGGPVELGKKDKAAPSEQTGPYSARMVALVLGVAIALPGCAAFTKAQPDITNTITTIQADIQEANLWISIIADAAQLLFGDSQSDAAVKFKQAEDAAKLALPGLTRAANGAGDVNQGTYDAAFSEFRSAYKAFVAAAQALGIVAPDGVLSVPHNGKLEAYRAPITKEVVRVPELHLLAGKK